MKLFGFNIGKKEAEPLVQLTEHTFSNFAFSTPLGRISKESNLALPQVNKYFTLNDIVKFGSDNLYPQLLVQMYLTSAIQGSIIEFITNAVIGGGYEFTDKKLTASQVIEQKTFEIKNKFAKNAKLLTRDYVIHRRVCVLIIKSDKGIISLKRLDPTTIRNSITGDKFAWSSDWSRGGTEMVTYEKYDKKKNQPLSLYVYQDETPGQDIYPIPSYNSILNWAYLDGEQSFFHKCNIQNSVFPSAVIRRPKEFSSIDEIQKFKEEISSKTGAQNGGKLLVLTGNGFDDVPEFTPVSANSNDNLFTSTSKEIKENICMAHSINPSIIGVKVSGSLGNSQELEISYSIFEKNVVMPFRKTMEEIFNDLLEIGNIKNSVEISNFQIIDKQITKS